LNYQIGCRTIDVSFKICVSQWWGRASK